MYNIHKIIHSKKSKNFPFYVYLITINVWIICNCLWAILIHRTNTVIMWTICSLMWTVIKPSFNKNFGLGTFDENFTSVRIPQDPSEIFMIYVKITKYLIFYLRTPHYMCREQSFYSRAQQFRIGFQKKKKKKK